MNNVMLLLDPLIAIWHMWHQIVNRVEQVALPIYSNWINECMSLRSLHLNPVIFPMEKE